jgi:hypothetical protein
MKYSLLMLSSLLLALFTNSVNAAGNPATGKRLFEEHPNKCLACHASGTKFNKATDIKQVEARVRKCDVSAKTNWYDDEIVDVTGYLNKQYYNF